MKVLIAVKGSENEGFYSRLARLVALRDADQILLAHVIDTGPREHLEVGRGRFLERRPLGRERAGELTQAEEEHGRAALQTARSALERTGVPLDHLDELILSGHANEMLRDLAEREGIDIVVVGGRPGRPGPHSIGKTARFLIDHCPQAALLIRTDS